MDVDYFYGTVQKVETIAFSQYSASKACTEPCFYLTAFKLHNNLGIGAHFENHDLQWIVALQAGPIGI